MSLVAIAILFTAGGIVSCAVHHFSAEQKMIRRFNNTPHVRIQEAAAGQDVRILGNVRVDDQEFISPFTKRRCVYYEAIVEESNDNDSWSVIAREVQGASFFVEDSSGRALVKAENLKIDAHRDGELTSGFMEDASVHLEEFLARHGQKSEGKYFNRTLRYREGILEPGEAIAVLGRVRWEADPDPRQAGTGYRDVPKRAVMEPPTEGLVWVSDIVEVAMLGPREPRIEG